MYHSNVRYVGATAVEMIGHYKKRCTIHVQLRLLWNFPQGQNEPPNCCYFSYPTTYFLDQNAFFGRS
jgi:hypothetical protein